MFVSQMSSRAERCVKQAVKEDNDTFKYVPDWFVTAEMVEKCRDEEWLEFIQAA